VVRVVASSAPVRHTLSHGTRPPQMSRAAAIAARRLRVNVLQNELTMPL
jgi:hypothetical protein